MRILLADDHEIVREGLGRVLRTLYPAAEITEANSYSDVYARAGDDITAPDIILLDLQMPGLDRGGFANSIRATCRAFPDVPVIVISGLYDSDVVLDVLRAGARGFVPKTARASVMLAAINLVQQGEIYVPSTILPDVSLEVHRDGRGRDFDIRAALTSRESDALDLLCQGHSNKQIARALEVAETTVKMHLRALFRKIGAKNRVEAIRLALETNSNRSKSSGRSTPARLAAD